MARLLEDGALRREKVELRMPCRTRHCPACPPLRRGIQEDLWSRGGDPGGHFWLTKTLEVHPKHGRVSSWGKAFLGDAVPVPSGASLSTSWRALGVAVEVQVGTWCHGGRRMGVAFSFEAGKLSELTEVRNMFDVAGVK